RAAAARMRTLPGARARRGRPAQGGAGRARRRPRAGAATGLAGADDRLSYEVAETAIVYPGTIIGEGCKILDYAVVGKQPTLSPRSTAKREALPPLELGAGTVVSTGAIVFAGTRIG